MSKKSSIRPVQAKPLARDSIQSGFFRVSLEWKIIIIIRKEKLSKILSDWKSINSVSVRFVALEPEESLFRGLQKYVKRVDKKITFSTSNAVSTLSTKVAAIASAHANQKGTIIGRDADSIQRIIHFEENADNFGEYDYDDLTHSLDGLDVNKFWESEIVKSLKTAIVNNSEIFGALVKR